jgi:hypothetical protein
MCYPFVFTRRSVSEDRTSVKTVVVNEVLKEVGLLGRKRVFYIRRKNKLRGDQKNHENI